VTASRTRVLQIQIDLRSAVRSHKLIERCVTGRLHVVPYFVFQADGKVSQRASASSTIPHSDVIIALSESSQG
jgi:hypothetical protein